MEYISPTARFLFFNGKDRYTVMFSFWLSKWFIFNNEEDTNALHWVEDKKIKGAAVNKFSAEAVLYDYLDKQ